MGEIITTVIDRFDGGIVNDPRDERENVCRVLTNFDSNINRHKLTPYRDSEEGDDQSAARLRQTFAIALRTGTTRSLYGLGTQSGNARAEVRNKDLTTGSINDLDDDDWGSPSNNTQGSGGATLFTLFVWYERTSLLYGATASNKVWAFSPSGSAFDVDVIGTDGGSSFSFTNIEQGLVHPKDDILYIPYDNKIAKNDNKTWTNEALVLPTYLKITNISVFGNYLAIAAVPLSGIGNSIVYLWDRDATLTTLSESIDWGNGDIQILDEFEGDLLGISLRGGVTSTIDQRVIFRLNGKKFLELSSSSTILMLTSKQKINNRIFFMMSITIEGVAREGVWSIGRSDIGSPLSLVHERTLDNNTAPTGTVLRGFFYVNDFLFQAFVDNGTHEVTKTVATAIFTNQIGIYESQFFNGGNSSLKKKLVGVTVRTEFLPTAGQVVLLYRKNEETSFTTIFTNTTNDSISHSAVNIESSGINLPTDYKEIQFRIESTGGAEPTALEWTEEITGKRLYD